MNTTKCDFSRFEKEEYELNLFGFTIKDFKFENVEFFSKQINKSVQAINNKYMELINKSNPATIENIKSSINQIEKRILKSTESNVQQIVNKEVENLLNIPDNVNLPTDRYNSLPFITADIDDLEKECDDLSKVMIQNSIFLKNLQKEMNSYKVDWIDKEDAIFSRGQNNLNIQLFDMNFLNNDPTYI